MQFQTYQPKKLNQLVKAIYERKVDFPVKMKMLPEENVTLVFNVGPGIQHVKGEKIDFEVFNPTQRFCFLSGLHTRPLYFDLQGLHVVGIIMLPPAVKAFFGVPTVEVKDQVVEGGFINELNYIEDHIRTLSSFRERALWLENYFYFRLNQAQDLSVAVKLSRTVQRMKSDALQGKRLNLETYSGYSKMHTHRIFKDWLGLTPGKVIRMKQFQQAITLMHQSELNLTQIGLESGFYDQAHFIRVFKEFAEMTPGQYFNKKSHIPGNLLG